MDSMMAFAMGQANRGKPMRVFDWNRAAQLIRDRKPESVSAGLEGDWEWTGGEIWRGGPIPKEDTYVFLASTWATPEIEIDGVSEDCWTYANEAGWDSSTYWPQSALDILSADV